MQTVLNFRTGLSAHCGLGSTKTLSDRRSGLGPVRGQIRQMCQHWGISSFVLPFSLSAMLGSKQQQQSAPGGHHCSTSLHEEFDCPKIRHFLLSLGYAVFVPVRHCLPWFECEYTPLSTPTSIPTANPTAKPPAIPTAKPTELPTVQPNAKPTALPTAKPTSTPTSIRIICTTVSMT